jgi:tetratricopeptide (TPR) repeat protein
MTIKKQDKVFQDLQRLLESQEFKSKEELEKFMGSLMGKPVPSFPKESLTIKEQAQDLIFEAIELGEDKGYPLSLKALRMDSDCIEAYEYLGALEPIPETAILYYKNGIEIGKRIFAKTYFKDSIGNFWIIHETRAFMRCMQAYADCLIDMGRYHDSVLVYEEMIRLNPNDNQGVRDQLLLYLIRINEFNKFRKYDKMYREDLGAFMSFNRALFSFKTEGLSSNSNGLLQKAIKSNKYVIPKLIQKTFDTEFPEVFGLGDENEALSYCYFAHKIWHETAGAIDWIKSKKEPVLKIVKKSPKS